MQHSENGRYIIPSLADNITVHSRCIVCGCDVSKDQFEIHDLWHATLESDHNMLNEVMEWARNVSKQFSGWIFKGRR